MSSRKDIRWFALLLTLVSVIGVGALINYLPTTVMGDAALPFTRVARSKQLAAHRLPQDFGQGVELLESRHYKSALTVWHRVLEYAPTLPEAHVNMGFTLLGLGRASDARDFFHTAIQLRRSQANGYYGLALALATMGQTSDAVAAMREYLQHIPKDGRYRIQAQNLIARWQIQASRTLASVTTNSAKPH